MLTVDELVDGGTVMETDATAIVSRVLMRGVSGGAQVCVWVCVRVCVLRTVV